MYFPTAVLVLSLLSTATAAVTGVTGANCNGYVFTQAAVQAAANASLDHLVSGSTVGSNDYPHQYNNREGFTFNTGCNPPYYEFPLFKSYIYTGGSPGPDRVIIGSRSGTSARFCDVITHSGASGNSFLMCANT